MDAHNVSDSPAEQAGAAIEPLTLVALPPAPAPAARPAPADPKQGARLRQAERAQIAWGRIDLDAMLSEDHAARGI